MSRCAAINDLRYKLRTLERPRAPQRPPLSFGVPTIDSHLPDGGLSASAVHELQGAEDDAARFGLVAVLVGRGSGTRAFWLRAPSATGTCLLDACGLAQYGLPPDHVVLSRPSSNEDSLWLLEEAARCRAFGAVIGEGVVATPVQVRRLQLAAEVGGASILLLPPPGAAPTPATTRWWITAAPARREIGRLAAPRWSLELLRSRGGIPGAWTLEWDDDALCLAVVADLADRSLAAAQSRPWV